MLSVCVYGHMNHHCMLTVCFMNKEGRILSEQMTGSRVHVLKGPWPMQEVTDRKTKKQKKFFIYSLRAKILLFCAT